MKRSKTVQDAINRLYATMATAAAKQAMNRVKYKEGYEAGVWLDRTVEWMDLAGADAIKWYYQTPRVDV